MKEVPIPSTLKQLATSTAIALFRGLRGLKRGIQYLGFAFGRGLLPLGRVLLRVFVLPVYRLGVSLHLKFQRFAFPSKNFGLFLISNRYLFHIVLGLATIATLIANLQTRQVLAQDLGQNSLLYALATNSEVEIVHEIAQESNHAQVSYLNPSTIVAIPHIDFDYDDTNQDVVSLSVPGTISALDMPEAPSNPSRAQRTHTETYLVKEGDTIGSIAQDFNVNVGTLLWNNGLTERQYIRPGDNLKIPPVSGMLVAVKKGDTITKLAARYQGDENEVRDFNRIGDETSLPIGTEIMIPGGRPPAPEQTIIAIVRHQQDQEPSDRETARETLLNSKTPKPADASDASLPAARLLWPTPGRVVTQYYGWKHTGVDIDGDFTSPLYAAYDGIVTKAGWNSGGYGLQIMIQHPNGLTTRYAHSSKLFVKVGDEVKRGQTIAMMGSTGHSTGSHLHFEVYVNGKRVNPLAYIR